MEDHDASINTGTWSAFLGASQAALDRYFAQQAALVELAIRNSPDSERSGIIQKALAANQQVLTDFLASHECAFRSLTNTSATSEVVAPPLLPPDQPTGDAASTEVQDANVISRIEAILRTEISRITGFSAASIARDKTFDELGLDSLSLAEVWSIVLTRIPQLEEYADGVWEVRSIRDVDQLLDKRRPTEPPQTAAPKWIQLENTLIESIAACRHIAASDVRVDADFERDLDLDVFTRERLFAECLGSHPGFRQAGRALLNAGNLGELRTLLSPFEGQRPCIEQVVQSQYSGE